MSTVRRGRRGHFCPCIRCHLGQVTYERYLRRKACCYRRGRPGSPGPLLSVHTMPPGQVSYERCLRRKACCYRRGRPGPPNPPGPLLPMHTMPPGQVSYERAQRRKACCYRRGRPGSPRPPGATQPAGAASARAYDATWADGSLPAASHARAGDAARDRSWDRNHTPRDRSWDRSESPNPLQTRTWDRWDRYFPTTSPKL